MIDWVPLVLAGLAGAGLGIVYFGGLWLTVRWLPRTQWPGLLTLGSLLVRLGGTLVGFYLVMAGRWERLLACLAGFVLVRFLATSWARAGRTDEAPPRKEGS
jgi:F1F0 ATPase subunit 2